MQPVWLTAVAFTANFMSVGTGFYIFNAFMQPLCVERGWTRTDISTALMIGGLIGIFGQLISGIVSQRLLPAINEEDGRVLAAEVLVQSSTVNACIINPEKTYLLTETMEKSYSQYGMQTFDMALYNLLLDEKIDRETALATASNPTKLDLKLKGIETASDWRMD